MEQIETAVQEFFDNVRAEGIDPDDVERAKERILANAVYARDSLRTGARVLGSALAIGLTVDDVENWPDRVKAVTPDAVKAAFDAILVPEHSVTAELLPEKTTGQEAELR